MNPAPEVTFVCCVESGWLEAQTTRLVASLRRFGGRFKDAPLIAVTPRLGPPLSAATQTLFKTHGVQHLRLASDSRYGWFNFYNKPRALVAAQPLIKTPQVCFLDSDLLIVAEPSALILADDEDFLAFPVECKEMGTSGPGDAYEPFWRACCEVAGIDIEALPWIETAQTHERVRMYFNSGLFLYRTDSGFADEYLRLTRALMDTRIGPDAPGYGLGFKEMVSVGFAVQRLHLRWRSLPYSHNYPMSSKTHAAWYSPELLAEACIVHYHDAMWHPFWDTFIECMRTAQREAGSWLAPMGPMSNSSPLLARVLTRVLKSARKFQGKRYLAGTAPV